jgi:hypothetical protein
MAGDQGGRSSHLHPAFLITNNGSSCAGHLHRIALDINSSIAGLCNHTASVAAAGGDHGEKEGHDTRTSAGLREGAVRVCWCLALLAHKQKKMLRCWLLQV